VVVFIHAHRCCRPLFPLLPPQAPPASDPSTPAAPDAAAPLGGNPELLVSKLGSQRVSNIFTHLRKVAQHPLLIRSRYTDEQVGMRGKGGAGGRVQREGSSSCEGQHQRGLHHRAL
jgi:hypothetical protein